MGSSNRLTPYNGLLGLGLLGLAVFAWLPDSYFRMVSWPWIVVWQSAFLIVIVGCLFRLCRFHQPFYRLGFGFDWVIGSLMVCLVLSSAGASFPVLAMQNTLLVGCYVIFLYGLRNSRFDPWQLCQGLVWVGAISAIISLILWRPTPNMWLSDNFYDAIRNRFPLGHHNFTGGYFVLVLPIAAGMTWCHMGWRRWTYGVLSLAIAGALYASGSRGAWLGGIILAGLILAFSILCIQGKARFGMYALSGAMVCLVLVLLGSNPRIRSLVPWAIFSSGHKTSIAVVDGPALDRVFMGQAALNIFKDRPILGLGPGNLGRVYERYRPLAAGAGLNQVQQLHNTPLQFVAELGICGGLIYLGTLVCLGRLLYKLQTLSSFKDKQLSVVIVMGFLGYGISSLSDYQLENIPIAATLTVLLCSFTQLGGALTRSVISQHSRHWGILLIMFALALMSQFWLRSTLSIWFTQQGLTSINESYLTQADDKLHTAATLTPWDPTPSALVAQQLSELSQTVTGDTQKVLRERAMEIYQRVLRVAPNDIWFNQNLAVLSWQTGDITTAHRAISKVIQLSPRSKNNSYYLLGLTYQRLGNIDAAIEAFALECLVNPQVILFESWQQELAPIRNKVFSRVLQHYQAILLDLDSEHSLQESLETHITTLRWWSGMTAMPKSASPDIANRPLLIQALVNIESTPDQSANLLDRCIKDLPSDASSCRLLNAWLRPEYLDKYFKTANLDSAERGSLRASITTHRTIRDWLQSITVLVPDNQRIALALLYRNYSAQKISSILVPNNLRQFSLPMSLKLFSLSWPREFAPLDDLIEKIRSETLGLPHPTQNNFQLTTPPVLEAP